MQRHLMALGNFVLVLTLLIGSTNATAFMIEYTATDVSDSIPGEDRWEYRYSVSDFTFTMDYGFSIFFDPGLYSDLDDPAPFVNGDWDPLTLQPDIGIPDDGIYDAQALVNGASLADPFTLSFVWLGAAAPGAQFYEVYDNTFAVVLSGSTQLPSSSSAPVPEPPAYMLMAFGIAGLVITRRRRATMLD